VSNRELKVDNGWVDSNSAVNSKLHTKGYSVGGYIDKGIPKYVLYRVADNKFERVHEFDTNEELNNMLKLLLED
jgi:hypothetical protein